MAERSPRVRLITQIFSKNAVKNVKHIIPYTYVTVKSNHDLKKRGDFLDILYYRHRILYCK